MLTVRQVAERLGVSKALVYSWVETGLLPHYRFGRKGRRGRVMVDEAELNGFVAAMRQEGRREAPAAPPKPPPARLRHLSLD